MPRQHQTSAVKKLFVHLKELGFTVTQNKSGIYRILPPTHIGGLVYTTHGTESCLHQLRRDFKRYYDVDLQVGVNYYM